MAQQQNCQGSQTVDNFYLLGPACDYEFIFLLGAIPLNNAITINSSMSAVAIATLLNSNRAGNTTGTFTAQQIGNDLEITISNIILGISDSVFFHTTIVNLDGCADINTMPESLTCSIIPNPRNKKKLGVPVYPATFCMSRFDRFGNPTVCKEIIKSGNATYQRISMNERVCCYKRIK